MMKINKKSKEGIKRKVALFSLFALFLNVAMVGVFVPSENVLRADNPPHITTAKSAEPIEECGKAKITLTITGAGDSSSQRKPVDVVFVIDRSGSMAGTYLENVKTAIAGDDGFIKKMNLVEGDSNSDRVAVVSYAGQVTDASQIDYPLGTNSTNAKNAVIGLEAGGGTCIECGLRDAYDILSNDSNPNDHEQFVILLSDGVANFYHPGSEAYGCVPNLNCPESPTDCTNNAVAWGGNIRNPLDLGVSVYSIGYRLDDISDQCGYGGETESLARQTLQSISSGSGYYSEGDPSDISDVFDKIAFEINNVAGYDAKIVEVLPPGINYVIGSAVPAPDDISVDGQTLTWEFGNLLINEEQSVSFSATTDLFGDDVLVDEYPGSQPDNYTRVEYLDYLNNLQVDAFPETRINIASCFECGDGTIDPGEECEIGDEQVCDAGNGYSGTQECSQDCLGWGECIPTESCGDGIVNGDEQCDEGGNNGQPGSSCDYDCTSFSVQEYGSISGYKYEDLDNDIITTEYLDNPLEGWTINLFDYEGSVSEIASTTTDADGYYEFTDLVPGDYYLEEEMPGSNWTQLLAPGSPVVVAGNENSENNNFVNYYEEELPPVYQCSDGLDNDEDGFIDYPADPGCDSAEDNDERNEPAPYCGDGVCNNNETCSTCSQDCGSCGGGGGGGHISPTVIKITNEKVTYLGDGNALVSWKTNVTTTNQVVYGDNAIETGDLGDAPEYDYDSVNEESDSMYKEHQVPITGLVDGVTYYFRPVADRNGSDEVVGEEVSYVFGEMPEEEGEVEGVTDSPAPTECTYLLEYIKLGADNNPIEVEKLERFLNEFEGENLPVNGIYEQADYDAVSVFQEKYLGDILSPWSYNKSTGYVYITTKKKINEIYCQKAFPLTAEQEAEVASFGERFLGMLTGNAGASDGSGTDLPSEDTSESFETGDEEDISGRVGGAKDETTEEDKDKTEDKAEDKTTEEDTTEAEDQKPEETTDTDEAATENTEDEDETKTAGTGYSEYLLWLTAIVIIAGIAWYYWPKKKEE